VVLIILVITTTLKYPDAVGEARSVEPHEEDLYPGEEAANITIHRSM